MKPRIEKKDSLWNDIFFWRKRGCGIGICYIDYGHKQLADRKAKAYLLENCRNIETNEEKMLTDALSFIRKHKQSFLQTKTQPQSEIEQLRKVRCGTKWRNNESHEFCGEFI